MPRSAGAKYSTKSASETAGQIPYFNEAGRGKTLLHIINLARFNPGIIGLMGDKGSGRSLLIQKLTERVNQKQGLVATITRNVKTKTDLYEAITDCFSIETTEGDSLEFIEQRIGAFFGLSLAQYRPVILAVDDVQKFSLSMLEFLIKLLEKYKRVSLVLVGDNHLAEMLKHLDTGNLSCHVTSLQPLNMGDIHQFVTWRLAAHLKDEEFEKFASITKGNMALLEQAIQAREQNQKKNTRNRISFPFALKDKGKKIIGVALLGVLVLTLLGGGAIYYLKKQPMSESEIPSSDVVAEEKPESAVEINDANPAVEDVEAAVAEITAVPVTLKEEVFVEKNEPIDSAAPIEVQKPKVVRVAEEKPSVSEPVNTPLVPLDDDSALLLSLPPTDYSIQVLGVQSKKTAQSFIASHSGKTAMYYFRNDRDGKEWYTVMYGIYSTRQEAQQAVAELPDDIKKTSPWARRLAEIHAMINASATQ